MMVMEVKSMIFILVITVRGGFLFLGFDVVETGR